LLQGDEKISDFSNKSYAGRPGFYRFRALGSLQFSLEHSLGNCAQEEPTERVNSLVVVQKPTGAVRLFIDPRDLNLAIKRPQYPMKTIDEVASRLKGAITSAFWMLQVASGS